jgi:hypothetical protein
MGMLFRYVSSVTIFGKDWRFAVIGGPSAPIV